MTPLLVWLPAGAAAALLGTALLVMRSDDTGASEPGPQPAPDAVAAAPAEDPAEAKAERDGDYATVLRNMERQLEDARRTVATMQSTAPTKAAATAVGTLDYKCKQELNALRRMGAARVPDADFQRAKAIKQETAALSRQASELYQQHAAEKQSPPAAPQASWSPMALFGQRAAAEPAPEQMPQNDVELPRSNGDDWPDQGVPDGRPDQGVPDGRPDQAASDGRPDEQWPPSMAGGGHDDLDDDGVMYF